jgi:hypothetical protein
MPVLLWSIRPWDLSHTKKGFSMKKVFKVLLIVGLLTLVAAGLASAQVPAYTTPFITSVTYQNVSNATANVIFNFYAENNATAIPISRQLPANAGASLFIGSLSELGTSFSGSSVVSSDQPIVATLVQIPQSTTVKNRPLSNGFSTTSSQVLIATVLKNQFATTTKFSVQNADSGGVDIKVFFYNADNTAAPAIEVSRSNIPTGAAVFFDLGSLAEITAGSFNGSAIVQATKTGTTTPANIVASALELSTTGNAARAFEGVSQGATTVYMASALCNFANATSNYAVQNTDQTQATQVTVTFSNGNSTTATVAAGAKASINGCAGGNPDNFNGSAVVTSNPADIVVIGKVGGAGRSTAFLGESAGAGKLALPYVRWTSDAKFNAADASRQRANIAIQNIGNSQVTGVVLRYLNKNGEVVGTHTLGAIDQNAKANSNATNATLASGHNAIELEEFGNPEGQPDGQGFGGSVIIEGPTGSQLIATVRIATRFGTEVLGEDYNGIPIQ